MILLGQSVLGMNLPKAWRGASGPLGGRPLWVKSGSWDVGRELPGQVIVAAGFGSQSRGG